MIKRGFDETAKKSDVETRFDDMEARFDEVATKEELTEVKKELQKDIAELRTDVTRIGHLPESLGRRADRLEDDIRLVKTKVGIR